MVPEPQKYAKQIACCAAFRCFGLSFYLLGAQVVVTCLQLSFSPESRDVGVSGIDLQ